MKKISKDSAAAILLVSIVLCVASFFVIRSAIRKSAIAPFIPYVNEYINIPDLKGMALQDSREQKAYIKGKVLIVDKQAISVDPLHHDIPRNIRALLPSEVESIVWLEWGKKPAGGYTDGTSAWYSSCDITVIDKSIPAIVGKESFIGFPPPSSVKRRGSRIGSTPKDKVSDYLSKLPRK